MTLTSSCLSLGDDLATLTELVSEDSAGATIFEKDVGEGIGARREDEASFLEWIHELAKRSF